MRGVTIQEADHVFSPSELNTAEDCLRRWALEYVWRLRTEGNAAARLGSAVHGELEGWLSAAVPPGSPLSAYRGLKAGTKRAVRKGREEFKDRPAIIAKVGMKPLPPPATGIVEKRFYLTTRSGLHFTGFEDWTGVHLGTPHVIDHKSTSDLKWAKTAEDLQTDVQALTYGAEACTRFNTNYVDLLWNYVTTSSRPKSHPVRTRLHLPQIIDRMGVVEGEARKLHILHRQKVDPMSLPPTVTSCAKYGGCPHQQRCNLSNQERMFALMSQDQQGQSMAERMGGISAHAPANGATQPLTQPQGTTPPPAAVPPPEIVAQHAVTDAYPSPVLMEDGKWACAQPDGSWQAFSPPAAAPPAVVTPPPAAAPPGAVPGAVAPQTAAAPPGAVPGAVPVAPQTAAAPPGAVPGAVPGQAPPVAQTAPYNPEVGPNPPEATDPAAQAQAAAVAAQAAAAAEEKPKKPGRPKGSTAKKTLTIEQQVFVAAIAPAAALQGVTPEYLQGVGKIAVAAFKAEYEA